MFELLPNAKLILKISYGYVVGGWGVGVWGVIHSEDLGIMIQGGADMGLFGWRFLISLFKMM